MQQINLAALATFSPATICIIAAILLVIFGSNKLPDLVRNVVDFSRRNQGDYDGTDNRTN